MKPVIPPTLALGAGLFASCCMAASVGTPQSTTVPAEVRALVAPADTLLAYKPADLFGDGTPAAVIVVRHPLGANNDYDFDNNPCELAVIHQVNGKLSVTDRSAKAVDCTYNDLARNASSMALNDNLIAGDGSIVYVNQKDRGDSSFYFAWSAQRHIWYLQRATASNLHGTTVKNVSASYPKDFGWTTMSSTDPEAIADILENAQPDH